MTLKEMISKAKSPYAALVDESIAQRELYMLVMDAEDYLDRRINVVDRSVFWHQWQ